MRKNEDREFSWAWKIFVPVVIALISLKLLLAGVFGNKPDKMGRDMKKSGKAPKCVRAFFYSKEHELSEEWFDGAELVAVLGEVNYDLTKATMEKDCSIYAVALTSAFCYDTKIVVLSVLGTYFGGMVVDHFIFGLNIKRRVCVISPKLDEIVGFILHDLHSGAILNEIIGAYDNTPRKEVITIVDKHEYRKLMDFVRKTDPKAFVTVYSVNEMRYQPKINK